MERDPANNQPGSSPRSTIKDTYDRFKYSFTLCTLFGSNNLIFSN